MGYTDLETFSLLLRASTADEILLPCLTKLWRNAPDGSINPAKPELSATGKRILGSGGGAGIQASNEARLLRGKSAGVDWDVEETKHRAEEIKTSPGLAPNIIG